MAKQAANVKLTYFKDAHFGVTGYYFPCICLHCLLYKPVGNPVAYLGKLAQRCFRATRFLAASRTPQRAHQRRRKTSG